MNSLELFEKILDLTTQERYPDIHITSKNTPIIRNHSWELQKLTSDILWLKEENIILESKNVEEIISRIAWKEWLEKLKTNLELDTSYQYKTFDRYRVNCYIDSMWYNIALRIIPSKIPSVQDLALWDSILEMCKRNKWLILVTWPTGSWKSTNLAAMVDFINTNYAKHIITIEDPIEFAFKNKKSLINQREIWNHTKWFANAIKSTLREDPDVIMVWEMRDPETIKAAITLAETGHLVISTLHTNDTVQTIDRIVDIFPSGQQEQIRMQLAMSLIWVVSQRLLPRADKEWRIASREILISNDAIRNLIINWKTHQLYSVIEVSWRSGMILMDKYLIFLYKKKIISHDTLMSYARDRDGIELLIQD